MSNLKKPIANLKNILFPHSIAVIGASEKEGTLNNSIIRNILNSGYKGLVYPVNPKAQTILGIKTARSILDVPCHIDLAVIIVPRDAVNDVVRNCAKKGVKGIVIITAGFKEIGEEGKIKEDEIKEIGTKYDMAVVGPNCVGIMNCDENVLLNATFAARMTKSGNISFVSQSGALAVIVLDHFIEENVGISKFISIGNKVGVDETDCLVALGDDPKTKVIIVYLEDIENPKRFMEVAQDVGKNKPILMLKVGRSKEGARAASSHTGALSSSDEILDSLFEQCGIIRVDTIQELVQCAICFSNQPVPKSSRVVIVSNGGGPATLVADAAIRENLLVPELSERLQKQLKKELSFMASTKNPIDIIGDADDARYEWIFKNLEDSSEVDSVIIIVVRTPIFSADTRKIAEKIVAFSKKIRSQNKPVFASFTNPIDDPEAMKILRENGIPNFPFSEDSAKALSRMIKFASLRIRRGAIKHFSDVKKDKVKKLFRKISQEKRTFLTEIESYEVLTAYGFPCAKYQFAKDISEAKSVAKNIGYPVVAKVVSTNIIHKTDVGGVKVNIQNNSQLKLAINEIYKSIKENLPEAVISGINIQEMIKDKDAVETIMGSKYDNSFGHILMFGLGGISVEAWGDVQFRIVPIDEYSVSYMVKNIKGYKLLAGFRGRKAVNISSLEECIKRLYQLVSDFPQIQELDLNPVFATPQGAKVADARIIIKI